MEKKNIESNIVLLGSFKPSIFDKLFFIKNKLINETDFLESSIFTTSFSRVETEKMFILIDPKKIVLINKENQVSTETLKSISIKILDENSINLEIVGFNFKWFIPVNNLHQYTKDKFYPQNNTAINKHFDSEDSAYGCYVSTNFQSSRMKLDIKPNLLREVTTNKEHNVLTFDFNFHLEFKDGKNKLFNQAISEYEIYKSKADKIISEYE